MTNKEWLSSLPAEDFYDSFKKAEEKEKWDINTRSFVIEWLKKEHIKFNKIENCGNCAHSIKTGDCNKVLCQCTNRSKKIDEKCDINNFEFDL